MEEEKKNPMDLNGDGKVSFGEKVEESVKKVYDGVKEDAKDALADAKVLAGKAKAKGKEVYDKAADKAKDLYAEAKEEVGEAASKAKAKINEIKEKKA